MVAPAGHGTSFVCNARKEKARRPRGASGLSPDDVANYIDGISRFAGRTWSSARAQPGACRNAGVCFSFCIATFICTAFLGFPYSSTGFARGTDFNADVGKRLTCFSG